MIFRRAAAAQQLSNDIKLASAEIWKAPKQSRCYAH